MEMEAQLFSIFQQNIDKSNIILDQKYSLKELFEAKDNKLNNQIFKMRSKLHDIGYMTQSRFNQFEFIKIKTQLICDENNIRVMEITDMKDMVDLNGLQHTISIWYGNDDTNYI